MHRYDSTKLLRIRTDYLYDVQTRYESEKQDLQATIDGDSITKEIRDARRELTSVERKPDDGVRGSYKEYDGLFVLLR